MILRILFYFYQLEPVKKKKKKSKKAESEDEEEEEVRLFSIFYFFCLFACLFVCNYITLFDIITLLLQTLCPESLLLLLLSPSSFWSPSLLVGICTPIQIFEFLN